MPTIPEQLGSLSILDTLKHPSVPGTMSNLPWQTAVGSWSEAAGWSPSSFVENPPTNTRSGLYVNTGKVSGNYGLGLKKTTGSLAAAARQFEVWLFYQGAAAASGYQLRVISEVSGKVQYKLTKWVEGAATPLIESAKELTFAENDSFFVARVGNKLGIYHRTGEGTPELVGSEVEDSTFTEGYVGFGGNGSNPKLINLQGGALQVATIAERLHDAPISDSFRRVENPLGSKSTGVYWSPSGGANVGETRFIEASGWFPLSSTPSEDYAYYNKHTFQASSSQYIYGMFRPSAVTANREAGIWLCKPESAPTEKTGYYLRCAGISGTPVNTKYTIEKWTAGSVEILKEVESKEFLAGSQIALVVGNGTVKMFAATTTLGEFKEIMSATDSTYLGGFSGIGGKGGVSGWRMRDFRTGVFTLTKDAGYARRVYELAEGVKTAIGGALTQNDVTIAALVRVGAPPSSGFSQQIVDIGSSEGFSRGYGLRLQEAGRPRLTYTEEAGSSLELTPSALSVFYGDDWQLIVARKTVGANPAIFEIYNFTTGVWSRENSSSTPSGTKEVQKDQTQVWFGRSASNFNSWEGDIAAVAIWGRVLSVAEVEALPGVSSLAGWLTLGPKGPGGMWSFNQAAAAGPIVDLTGGGATQSEVKGTDVMALDSLAIPFEAEKEGGAGAGFVNLMVGGRVKAAKRWVLVNGILVAK